MTDWIDDLCALRETDKAAVLVTVAGVRGSAPREVGARMLVSLSETAGTIGGGELEYQCTQIAAKLIADKSQAAGFLRRFPLGSNCGQCCGGVVDILFERLPVASSRWLDVLVDHWRMRRPYVLVTALDADGRPLKTVVSQNTVDGPAGAATVRLARERLAERAIPARVDTPGRGDAFLLIEPAPGSQFDIAVFGAGHVGSAVVHVLAALDCDLRWIDSRRHVFPPRLPKNVRRIEAASPEQEVAGLPAQSYYLVMTHSHALDQAICATILARGDFAWCGLIGSQAKRRRFEQRLRQQGISDTQLKRLTCPIGVRGIDGRQPAEIAIATAAEILRRRERQIARAAKPVASVHRLRH